MPKSPFRVRGNLTYTCANTSIGWAKRNRVRTADHYCRAFIPVPNHKIRIPVDEMYAAAGQSLRTVDREKRACPLLCSTNEEEYEHHVLTMRILCAVA